MGQLGGELLISFGLVAVVVVIHLVGLMALIRLTQLHLEHFRTPWLAVDRLVVPLGMATGLFAIHGAEVWVYALTYWLSGAVPQLESALYVSAGAYSTAGWMGARVPDGWRVTASLEALTGMLLVGWSTAFLFQTLHRILQTEENHPLPAGAIAPEPAQPGAGQDEAAGSRSASPRPNGSGRGAPAGTN